MNLSFSTEERTILEDALRQAAKDYRDFSINSPEVGEQFKRQSDMATNLLERVEALPL